jgi:hypothetical protein
MSLVLVPSILHEAFGMVVVDAMLHGLPVIVSEVGALAEAAAGAAAAILPVPMVILRPPHASQLMGATGTAAGAAAAAAAASAPAARTLNMGEACAESPNGTGALTELGGSAAAVAAAGCVSAWLQQQCSWDSRQYQDLTQQQQQGYMEVWSAAIKQVLSDRQAYMQASRRSREAAEAAIQRGPGELAAFVQWLHQVAAEQV